MPAEHCNTSIQLAVSCLVLLLFCLLLLGCCFVVVVVVVVVVYVRACVCHRKVKRCAVSQDDAQECMESVRASFEIA